MMHTIVLVAMVLVVVLVLDNTRILWLWHRSNGSAVAGKVDPQHQTLEKLEKVEKTAEKVEKTGEKVEPRRR